MRIQFIAHFQLKVTPSRKQRASVSVVATLLGIREACKRQEAKFRLSKSLSHFVGCLLPGSGVFEDGGKSVHGGFRTYDEAHTGNSPQPHARTRVCTGDGVAQGLALKLLMPTDPRAGALLARTGNFGKSPCTTIDCICGDVSRLRVRTVCFFRLNVLVLHIKIFGDTSGSHVLTSARGFERHSLVT
jgi:hypothetical protein